MSRRDIDRLCVAAALADEATPEDAVRYRTTVYAILQNLREPTKEMLARGSGKDWRAMVDKLMEN